MNNLNEYKRLLMILYNFYNDIKDKELKQITNYLIPNKKIFFNIDFNKQFFISNNYKNDFVHYDKKRNIFHLSLDIPKKNFDELKLESVTFDDYIKGEFIYELIRNVIDLRIDENILYNNEFGGYKKQYGSYSTFAAIEYLTREFTEKNHIFYLYKQEYEKLLIELGNIINDENKEILYNGDISNLLENESLYKLNIIKKMEEEYFEEEFKLKKGILFEEELDNITYKNIDIQKIKLKEELNNIKKQITE